jgi:hypothetical protein
VAKPPPHRAHLALAQEFYSRYQGRIVGGLAVYGEFDPATDKRCLSEELIEELLDCGSYLDFCEQKYPSLRSAVQKIRAKVILLYGEAKKLKELELTLGKEGTKSE